MGAFATALHRHGIRVEEFDVCNGPQMDLADDSVWSPTRRKLSEGYYSGMFVSPPCSTFSVAREALGGPPVVRGVTGSDRYGFRKFDQPLADTVRLHNLLAIRVAQAFDTCVKKGLLVALENPLHRFDKPSILLF